MCSLSNIFVHVCIGSFSRILYCLILFQILSSIIALLREHPKAHILTTGHSLGSIFATFVAIDVKANVRHYDYNDYLLNPNAYTLFPNDTGVERGSIRIVQQSEENVVIMTTTFKLLLCTLLECHE